MPKLEINVQALVKDAVANLDTLNETIDEQNALTNRLAKAQHDLEASSLKLADAQDRLAKNTDPAKQHDLESAVLSARVALDRQGDEVNQLAREYVQLDGATEKTSSAFDLARGTITDFNAAIEIGERVVGMLNDAFQATVIRAAEWGDSMGDLAQLTGQSVEDTSRLAATLELVGIDASSLGRILKSMTKEGLNLNLKTLLELNEEYNAIQDPVQRNTFLFRNFGKAAEDMAEVMGRSQEELEALAAAADKSGKVIGEEAAAQAEKFNTQLKIAQQQLDGTLVHLGGVATEMGIFTTRSLRDAIVGLGEFSDSISEGTSVYDLFVMGLVQTNPKLIEFANAFDDVGEEANEAKDAVDDNTRSVEAWGDRWAGIAQEAKAAKAMQDAKQAASDLRDELAILTAAIGGEVSDEQENFYNQQGDLAGRAQELKDEIDRLTESNGQYYETVQGNGMTTAELELATAKLARAQENLATETDPVKQAQLKVEIEKQQEAISGASTVVSGYVDNSKKIGELTTEYEAVTAAMQANRDAHEEAAARIVFSMIQQQMAADGLSKEEIAALTDIGEELGIYDEKTADIMRSVQRSVNEHGANAEAILTDVRNAYAALRDEPDITKRITVETHYVKYGDENPSFSPGDGGGGSSNSTITPDDNEPVGPGYAQGGSFIVPGSGTGDRPYTVNLTPGERVDVTPVGKAPTGGITFAEGSIVVHGGNAGAAEIVDQLLAQLGARVRAYAGSGYAFLGG